MHNLWGPSRKHPGPFIVYINDIFNISNEARWIGYADDTTILLSGRDTQHLINAANGILNLLRKWCEANYLRLNAKKTQAILFRTRNTALPTLPKLCVADEEIKIVSQIKTLGVIFSEHLSWDQHVELICSKLNKITGVLNRHRHFLPSSVKRIIYNALFLSTVNYGHMVWATTSKANMHKLSVCQKRAIRIIANAPYRAHTMQFYEKFQILPIASIYSFRLACTYRSAIRAHNIYYLTLFNLQERRYIYETRTHDLWITPFCRTTYGTQSLSFNIASLLNRLCILGADILTSSTSRLFTDFLSLATFPHE